MRIAHVVYQFPCLSEPFVMDQITGMLERGHDIRVFAEIGGNDDPVHPQISTYGLLDRTRRLPRTASSPRRQFSQAAKALIAQPRLLRTVLPLGRARKMNTYELARLHGFVWPRIAPFDIVHCQFGCVGRSHGAAKRLWNAKLVVSFRGHDFSCLPRTYGPGMYATLFREADAVLAVCDYAARRVLELGCPPEKLVTHHSGTDLTEFTFRERHLNPGEEVRLLTVSRLEESKGLVFALRAIAELVHRYKRKVRYGIVGGGSQRAEMERLAIALRIDEHVTFHGPQPRPRVRELMEHHHLFVLPSVTTRDGGQEGIPGTVREAMATGLPVVSTWHAGIPELVEHGVSGFLVPERDVAGLAERIEQLITTPATWPVMGHNGRARVEARFDITRLNDRLEAFYRHILAGGSPALFEQHNPRTALAA